MKMLALAIAVASPLASAQSAPPLTPAFHIQDIQKLRDSAQKDNVAWEIVEGLTTEIGPRLAGSDAEARARDWGVAKLKALGFRNVHIETFEIEGWERGVEQAEIIGSASQRLVITALGNSGATPAAGIEAELIEFESLAALEAAPANAIAGKIVFLTHRMTATQDASSYGAFVPIRVKGPSIAAKKGALATIIRSIGSDHHRLPHAGVTRWEEGQQPIPAAALSVPDAEQLERLLSRKIPVRLRLVLTPRFTSKRISGNIIAEIPGRDPNAGLVLVGGHLDSWDLGTGAIDDGAGVAITTAAAHALANSKPLRTIRVVWFGSEEPGNGGDIDYFRRHGSEKHVFASESDLGADRVWKFDTRFTQSNEGIINTLADLLAPLGIARGGNEARGGSDIKPLADSGTPVVALMQDATRYFEIHHTPDDTLDKIDRDQMNQNVAAWTAMIAVAANAQDWPAEGVKKPAATHN